MKMASTGDDVDLNRVRFIHKEKRLLHGTTISGKASIRENGFDVSKKLRGATQAGIETVERMASAMGKTISEASYSKSDLLKEAKTHHHLTNSKATAIFYAGIASEGDPAIARIVPDESLSIELDPHDRKRGALRTSKPILSGYVLPSKKGPLLPGPQASRAFQADLRRNGIEVPQEKAALLLKEVQSDSEDDFVPPEGNHR